MIGTRSSTSCQEDGPTDEFSGRCDLFAVLPRSADELQFLRDHRRVADRSAEPATGALSHRDTVDDAFDDESRSYSAIVASIIRPVFVNGSIPSDTVNADT